ncbi:1,4-alpha-glucan branching protein GlgB [Hamadaea tsunoensis]|uniref:1,4-alpha-glucan branching protein GlgB n=1 Tax=Hamadaea tsunoensis TaxID=53368 RepID=UPI000420CF6B|nr:1,4-alpha-glucan branching protein GlgB [Hamadaea tsunoensis]
MRPSDLDLHLLAQGRHEQLWHVLGAHPAGGGCDFAVWAPQAREVRVLGDFSGWGEGDGTRLEPLGTSGVWFGHVPGAGIGQRYKYKIHGVDGSWTDRADPMAQRAQTPPDTASEIWSSDYQWGDDAWMKGRAGDHHRQPMSIYEVHLGSWRPGLSYRELADDLVEYVAELGFTHVEFMPVMAHPFGPSWGYQVTGFYAPDARLGTPDDFRFLVDRFHQAGIGVILDWVPAHFPKDDWALARFDGAPLYEYADPRRGEHPDWGSLVFDYGRNEVRNFLVANARYWCAEFHADGLRVDAVASMLYLDYSRQPGQWVPNIYGGNTHLEAVEFLKQLNSAIYTDHPGVAMIAEESTAWPGVSRPVDWGGLGFGLKWNMGWMHDTLAYAVNDPLWRGDHHDELTLPGLYAFDEQFLLPLSHDEVVHGKRSLAAKLPGDRWQRMAGLRGLLAYMWAFPGKKLLFMGGEIGVEHEWSEQWGLDWAVLGDPLSGGLRRLVGDLNRVYRDSPELWELDGTPSGWEFLRSDAYANVVAFARRGPDGSRIVCVASFSGCPHPDYRLWLPAAGPWTEVVNTDSVHYGGSGLGNLGSVRAAPDGEATVCLGAYAVVWLVQAAHRRH